MYITCLSVCLFVHLVYRCLYFSIPVYRSLLCVCVCVCVCVLQVSWNGSQALPGPQSGNSPSPSTSPALQTARSLSTHSWRSVKQTHTYIYNIHTQYAHELVCVFICRNKLTYGEFWAVLLENNCCVCVCVCACVRACVCVQIAT